MIKICNTCTSSIMKIDEYWISYDFYNSVFNKWMFQFATDNLLISWIVRVDSNCNITEHSFDTSCRNSNFIESFINERRIIFNFKSFLSFFVVTFSWNLDSFNNFEAANFDKFRVISFSQVSLVDKIPYFFLFGFFFN